MSATTDCCVIGSADGDEDTAGALMTEVQLDLFKWTLDQERSIRVNDRPDAFLRKTRRESDQQLLPDSDVEDAARVAIEDTGGANWDTPISARTTAVSCRSERILSVAWMKQSRMLAAAISLLLHLRH